MNLAILNCDRIGDALAKDYGQYPELFAALFHPVNPKIALAVFDVLQGQLPIDVHAADAYLITGSRHGVNDGYPWIAQLEEFVRQAHAADKKVIGICFGHQLIAKALGGTVVKSPKGWGVGVLQNQVAIHKEWMVPPKSEFSLLISHQDQVVTLPPGAQVIASSDFCPNYMLQIGNTVLTVQGHPEFTKDYAENLLQARKAILSEEVFARGMQSLVLEHEHVLIAQWIINFLQC